VIAAPRPAAGHLARARMGDVSGWCTPSAIEGVSWGRGPPGRVGWWAGSCPCNLRRDPYRRFLWPHNPVANDHNRTAGRPSLRHAQRRRGCARSGTEPWCEPESKRLVVLGAVRERRAPSGDQVSAAPRWTD